MKVGLVLGAGGTVGMAYHAGVLRALEVEGGFVANRADLIIGTSAGSVIGAYLRTGWTTEDFWALASDLSDGRPEAPEIFAPRFRSPVDLVRRGVGSAFVLGRSVVPWPLQVPDVLRRVFPGGMYAMNEGRRRFAEELPEAWPATSCGCARSTSCAAAGWSLAGRERRRFRSRGPSWRHARSPACTSR